MINTGGITDPLGRPVLYSATGLPVGLSIDPSSGVISGIYDANGFLEESEIFSVVVSVLPQ